MRLNTERLLARLDELSHVGALPEGGRTRLALTDEDRQGRDLIVRWLIEAGSEVTVDQVGNIYGILHSEKGGPPVMTGSHIDTVHRAGALDGCYGVVAGIEVLDAINTSGITPDKTFVVAAFTNEEGVRFMPDLLGSRVLTKELGVEDALQLISTDGQRFGADLQRIGYAGTQEPWTVLPAAFVELHIEQGPILDRLHTPIGVVEGVQGYSWWQISITGQANHAGTTPMDMRRDAGVAAMRVINELTQYANSSKSGTVATVGTFSLHPNAINVIASRASFTVDLRDANDTARSLAEHELRRLLAVINDQGFDFSIECIARNHAVRFDKNLCDAIEEIASSQSVRTRRLVSGASHDAQMLARICPTAMIFVPSRKGISHNPEEHTDDHNLALGADILWKVILKMVAPT